MSTKLRLFNVLVALVTLVAIAGAFSAFQRKRSSFERLDFQFHWNNGVILVDKVDPDSGASKAGLKPGDKIWMVGGVATSEIEGLKKTLRRIGPVPILVARGNQTLTLTYTAPDLKIDYQYLFLTFIGFLYLAIGLFTLFRGATSESSLFFLVTLLAFVVYVYSPAGAFSSTYKTLYLLEEFARIFLPPLTLHFFLRFPRPLFKGRWTILSLYVPPTLLAMWVIDLLLFSNSIRIASPELTFRLIDRWEMLHFAVYFTLAFVALTYTYRTAPVIGEKKQIKWIYLGMAVGFIPFLILYLIPYIIRGENSAYTSLAILPLAFIPLAFAVSILKYKLWDVEVIIKEILAYTITFVFGMIAFSTVNLFLSQLIEEHLALERNFLAFASGLLIAGVLVPIKGKIESVIEMFLYRETYRHRRAINEFAQELATFHDLHELIEIIRERLAAAINIHQMNLYVREGGTFAVYTKEPGLPARIPVDELKLPSAGPWVLDHPRLPDQSDLADQLLKAGYRYAFSLRHRSELQGVLLCSTKPGEEPLSRDDLHLVGSLTAPVALAIENARLYGRLRRQLDQIRSLKEYNENIIESSSSAIVVVAIDGTILTANKAFWSLLGSDPDNTSRIDDIFPIYPEIRRAGGLTVEMQFVNHRGEERELTVTAAPFTASDAPEGTTVVVIGDISDRVRLERQLQEKERLASLGLLAAGVAHEVNTPLTGISSYAQLLLAETSPDDPRYAILKKMEQQTFRASHLVNNLLDLAANRPTKANRISLAEVVRGTLSLHEDLFKPKSIQLHVEEQADPSVLGDSHEVQQVLVNLLLNARDAVGRGGNIWVTLSEENGQAVITIRDDGRGVAPDLIEKIFKPLVTTKRGQGGTGLGLAISDRIVRSMGGEITVESVPGKGATFKVSIPVFEKTLTHQM